MSDSINPNSENNDSVEVADDSLQVNENPATSATTPGDAPVATPAAATDPAVEESTIGTGTSMALGCIAATIVLIGIGLLFLAISTFF